jgi:hypothetical protein
MIMRGGFHPARVDVNRRRLACAPGLREHRPRWRSSRAMAEDPESTRGEAWAALGQESTHASWRVGALGWGASAGLAWSIVQWALDPTLATASLVLVAIVPCVFAWRLWHREETSKRAKLARYYRHWENAVIWRDAVIALADACATLRGAWQELTPEVQAQALSEVEEVLRARGIDPKEVLFGEVREVANAEFAARLARARLAASLHDRVLRRELDQAVERDRKVAEVLAEARKQADEIVSQARLKSDQIVMTAHRAAQAIAGVAANDAGVSPTGVRVESVVYTQPGQVPSFPHEVERAAMKRAVEEGEQAAVEGRVFESHAAGVILQEPARWSPYAAPFPVTKELLQLFDPAESGPMAVAEALKKPAAK